MNESYNELLVKKEQDGKQKLLRIICVIPTVLCGCLTFLTGNMFLFIFTIIMGAADYFIYQWTDIEYEYLYIDREISIDKIFAKSRRKRVCTIDIHKIEILAPAGSYHLDAYKNRNVKATDYSAGKDVDGMRLYHMYYEGNRKFILNLTDEFAGNVRGIEPRKVFTD